MNVFLSPAAQTQLATLKAANAVTLTRFDAKKTATTNEKTAVDKVRTELDQAKTALKSLSANGAVPTADQVNAFIKEFTELQSMLKTQTDKDATLQRNAEVRSARSNLRKPLSELSVMDSLRDAGIATSRDGLVASGTPVAALSADAVAKLDATFTQISDGLSNATSRLSTRLGTIATERARASERVDAVNKRTEANFMKFYQMTQLMNSESGITQFGAY